MDESLPPQTGVVESAPLALPSSDQVAWQQLELGMFVHFGPSSWMERELDDGTLHPSAFDPRQLDTDQWVDVAKSMGAKYIVLTAKHTGGFCLWQTHTSEYGVRSTPWRGGRGDVMAELAESCHKAGMKLGFYLCPRDDHMHALDTGKFDSPAAQAGYNEYYRAQLTELLTRYGDMAEVWFDGSTRTPVGDILERHAPHAMVFGSPQNTIRWVGNEEGIAPDPCWHAVKSADAASGRAVARDGSPDADQWLPVEVDARFRRGWFYSSSNGHTLKSLDHLLWIYYQSVGRGAVLLLNHGPDSRGLIPEPDVIRAQEFGAEIRRRFGAPLAQTAGAGELLMLEIPPGSRTDHVILQEDIRHGQRVRQFVVEARTGDGWLALAWGESIGYKRIVFFSPVAATAIRFRVIRSAGQPIISQFLAFAVGDSPINWREKLLRGCDQIGWWSNAKCQRSWHSYRRSVSARQFDGPGEYELRFDALQDNGSPILRSVQVRAGTRVLESLCGADRPGTIRFALDQAEDVEIQAEMNSESTIAVEGPMHLVRRI